MQVNVGNLPVWNGVQDRPGLTKSPFVLGVTNGVISLVLTGSELDRITQEYSSDSYSFITSPPGTSEWGTRLGDLYFQKLAEQSDNLDGKSVLEIGSGTLYIAERVARELEAELVIACDPAIRDDSDLNEVKIVREYFGAEVFEGQSFDVVLSINNLEHVPDPFSYLNDVRRLLEAKNGMLYLVVPDSTRGLQTGDVGICVHEHLSYFTPDSFTKMLAACNFETSWLHTQDDTIFAVVRPGQGVRGDGNKSESCEALLERFEARFHQNLDSARRLISEKKQDSRLAIHGCNIGLNNLLALLEIQSDPNIFLFDLDSNKVDRYLPAFDRPIMSATDDTYKTMEYAIVSALTFYDEISANIVRDHNLPSSMIHPITPLD